MITFYDAVIQPLLALTIDGAHMGYLTWHLGNTSFFKVSGLFDSDSGFIRDAAVRARVLDRMGAEVDYGILVMEPIVGSQGDYRAEISSLFNPTPGDYRIELVVKAGLKTLTRMIPLTVARPPSK